MSKRQYRKTKSKIAHKRMRKDFRRSSKPRKTQRDRILIVCEDKKHTPAYFEAIRESLELHATEVRISGESGSAPSSVYEYAKNEIDSDIKNGGNDNTYDRVYCVFDKDNHDANNQNYTKTLEAIKNNPKHSGVTVIAINSVPCFEQWILFHFSDSTKPQTQSEAAKELKNHITGYTKSKANYKTLYVETLKPLTEQAIKNSKAVLTASKTNGFTNPISLIHVVIEDLINESKK